jgi:hypothetical protein
LQKYAPLFHCGTRASAAIGERASGSGEDSSACRSADRAAARRDGGKHRMDSGEVDCGRAAIPDASLTDIKASKLSAMSIEDIGAHHVQGDVSLLAGPGDLGDAVTAIGRHPIAHGFSKAGQQRSARIAYFRQDRAPSLRHLGQIAVDVDSIASHDPIVRTSARAGGQQPRRRKTIFN